MASASSNIYVRRVGEVEAQQWDGSVKGFLSIKEWLINHKVRSRLIPTSTRFLPELVIETPEGNKHARKTNWVVYEGGVCLLFTEESFNRQYMKQEFGS